MRLIDIYARERTISREERQMLSVILLFPEKFWKISNHYINSHKAWVSERDIEKIRQMIEFRACSAASFWRSYFKIIKNHVY